LKSRCAASRATATAFLCAARRRRPIGEHLTARLQVDTIRAVTIPLLKNFGLSAG
jgi:hypothetical protein